MRSIQTKIILMISGLMLVMVAAFLLISTIRTNAILNDDSDRILLSAADYYVNDIDDYFRSTEQSVVSMYNYAVKRTEIHPDFLNDKGEKSRYTTEISGLAKSIAENTRGAMAVYLRYNPDDFGPTSGFWYTIRLKDNTWVTSILTDMSLYDKDDLEHVGWYYVPVKKGSPIWMDPYHNANMDVDMISYIIPYFYNGYTVGILGMDISLDLLKESVSKVSVYESGRAFLVDKKGNLIYHEDYPDGMSRDKLSEREKNYYGDILQTREDTVNICTDLHGVKQKLILKELRNGMILGVYAPLNEIRQPQHTLQQQQLLVAVIILFSAILSCLILVRTIIAPLKKMTAVAEHYAEGDFSEEMSAGRKDEVGVLSRSLQTMSHSLKEQIEKTGAASRSKSAFLAGMSHELKTPINSILSMNDLIYSETEDEFIREHCRDIRAAGTTLLSMINSILDFSRLEDGRMEINPKNYELAVMIQYLVNSVSERAKEKGIRLYTDIDGSLPSVLNGDDVRITQIIMNLLTNAVKYTKKGSITLSMTNAGITGKNVSLAVKVKDTGTGIKKEDMDRIFDSFTRVGEEDNSGNEGTGIGLSIASRLLSMMNSRLNVYSEYGEGSEFSFVIRQGMVDKTPVGDFSKRSSFSSTNTSSKN